LEFSEKVITLKIDYAEKSKRLLHNYYIRCLLSLGM